SNLMQPFQVDSRGHTSSRPKPRPMQNVLHVTSDSSASSSDGESSTSNSSSSPSPTLMHCLPDNMIRCSRCQRSQSIDIKTGKKNMVQYGLNSWYCTRCAGMVGF
ncbi:hypothetical protein K431DRAFT_206621, partial [Polychaeton citri CBS 116435]